MAKTFTAAVVVVIFCLQPLMGYSVLSHEALVDALWGAKLRAILLSRFPNATPEDLKQAHGFAYGGAIIQDLGYYPHGSTKFSDLTHYVRTGDFVVALFQEAHGLNDLAFALGALSHYVSDLDGHRYGTNVGEPLLYPKLRKKFGNVITYEDDPLAHLKTEFGFDVLQVARGNFAPQAYHDFIGFYVAKDLLQRAFHDTYGLELADLFGDFDLAINSYRSAVSRTIPMATRVAWSMKKNEIRRTHPGQSRRKFVYLMKRSSYRREWGKRDEPSKWERFLGFLLRLLPPIGPLKALGFKMPTPPAERLFMVSFERATDRYSQTLAEAGNQAFQLDDENYDVGMPTPAGVYRLNDETQAFWLHQLAVKKFATVTPAIRQELLAFYNDPNASIQAKQKTPKVWRQTMAELQELRSQNIATHE
ncbi:MAG TPA: zinc dependent phospholipase C family protein [Bryobacteraceae bacterium]